MVLPHAGLPSVSEPCCPCAPQEGDLLRGRGRPPRGCICLLVLPAEPAASDLSLLANVRGRFAMNSRLPPSQHLRFRDNGYGHEARRLRRKGGLGCRLELNAPSVRQRKWKPGMAFCRDRATARWSVYAARETSDCLAIDFRRAQECVHAWTSPKRLILAVSSNSPVVGTSHENATAPLTPSPRVAPHGRQRRSFQRMRDRAGAVGHCQHIGDSAKRVEDAAAGSASMVQALKWSLREKVCGAPRVSVASLFRVSQSARPARPLMVLIWPKAGCALIAFAATASVNFLPLGCAHSSRHKDAESMRVRLGFSTSTSG